jgi:hypothetical protein
MLLAGEFLVREKLIQTYTQEWTTTNHNNVRFLDFFELPEHVHFQNIPQTKVNWSDGSFAGMTSKYVEKNGKKWPTNLRKTFKTLKIKASIQQIINKHLQGINSHNLLGVHIRRTCKLGVNKMFDRASVLLTNQQYLDILQDYNLNFYISTDNNETQTYFKNKLKERCKIYKNILSGTESFCSTNYTRESVLRFTDSLHTIIDFYTLLNCKRFIGTESSSFSALIYHLRNNANDFKIISNV